MSKLVALAALGALALSACGGKEPPPPVPVQLRDALQHVVAAADAGARVVECGGPAKDGPGRYVCSVDWPHGGDPPAFTVRVDAVGGWRTSELPRGPGGGGEPIGSIEGHGLRMR